MKSGATTDSSKQSIVGNLSWALAGKMTNLVSGLVVGIIVARYLGPEKYGLMNYVVSFVFLFQTISVFGLDNIEIREEARHDVDHRIVMGTSFVLRCVLSVICIALCVLTSWQMGADRYTIMLVAIYSLVILFNTLVVIRNYYFSQVRNKHIVQAEISRTLICIVIKLALLIGGATLTWFVVANMLDMLLVGTGYVMAYRHDVGSMRQWRFDAGYARFLLRESFPLLLTNAAVIVYQRIDQVMIGDMVDKESVGYFSVASRFVEILIYIPMILSQTISPLLTRALKEEGRDAYIRKSQRFMNTSLWLSIIGGAVMSVLAYWAVLILFGETYLPAVAILQIMAFKAAGVALSNTAGAMLVIEGLQRYAIFRDMFGCLVCVVLNYLLLPHYGAIAAAFVTIIANVAAGYVADAFIPAYRHLFVMQTKALFTGWRNLNIKNLLAATK
ncbi:MAG: flippase [Bacteroidales bacterium]|nr:flippase [Candidatus Liminaster caballi]